MACAGIHTGKSGGAAAQWSSHYDLSHYTFDSGSGALAGSQYLLVGTLGESLSGPALGADYAMVVGYEPGIPGGARYPVYLPMILRNNP